MIKYTKLNDKLYFFAGDLVIYIINHQLIGFEANTEVYYNPYKAFNYLIKLFENKKSNIIFPKTILKFFINTTNVGSSDCVLGYNDPFKFDYCLDFSLTINKSGKNAYLYDFVLRFPNNVKILINSKIKMLIKEVYYTLGNIAVTNNRDFFNSCQPFENDNLYSHITRNPYFTNLIKDLPDNAKNSHLFTVAYLQDIKNKLENNSIIIDDFLSLSGAFVLAQLADFDPVSQYILNKIEELKVNDAMSLNQKIIYYSLVKSISKKIKNEKITKTIQNNKQLFKLIEKNLSKKIY